MFMSSCFEVKIFRQYKKSWLYKALFIYIIYGVFIFTVNRGEYAYFELLHYVISYPFLIAIFLITSVLCGVLYINYRYYNNYSILLRFGSRRSIIISNIKLIFYIVSNVFILMFMASLIFTNVFANRNYYIGIDSKYNVLNVVSLFVSACKVYIFLFIIGLVSSVLSFVNIYLILVVFLVIMISFMGILPNGVLMFLPGYYVSNYHIFDSFSHNVIYSLVYLVLSFGVVFLFYIKRFRDDIL